MSAPKMVPSAAPKSRRELRVDMAWGAFWIAFGSAVIGLGIAYAPTALVIVPGVAFVAYGAFNINRKLVEDFALVLRSVVRNGRGGVSSYPGSALSAGYERTEVLTGPALEPGGRASWDQGGT